MIIEHSIDEAYLDYKKYLVNKGELKTDERGDKVYQIPYYNIIFMDWYNNIGGMDIVPVPKKTGFNFESLQDYSNQLLDHELHGFVYTYGNRLREYFSIDQIESMMKHIDKDIDSRRAVAITIDPSIDNYEDDIPCLQHLAINVYDNHLIMEVLFRSNDIKYAFVPNMYALMNLQLYMGHELGITAGDMYYTCYNPHWKLK